MSNPKLVAPYPQKLKGFLSLAERDLLEEKVNGICEFNEGLPGDTKNILIDEIYDRLQIIEDSFKDLELDLEDSFTDNDLPKAPLCMPVEVLDIFLKSIKKLKRDGIHVIGDLYRKKLTQKSLDDTYYVNQYLQTFLNKSLEQIGLPTLYKESLHLSAVLNRLTGSKWEPRYTGREALTLPDILIYRFHDSKYRSRLDKNEVHILETVVWGNMRPDDAVKEIDGLAEGFLPFHIRIAGCKLVRN